MMKTGGTNNEQHMKGFMFDSLVYRFKDYQAKAFIAEKMDLMKGKGYSEPKAHEIVLRRHERDLMRFIQILDEAIGEHD